MVDAVTTIDTAHIETMTAEVQVLMVGNRQITLSVAKQLDRVPLSEIDAFGRVRISDRSPRDVIGRHISDGSLVLSSYEKITDELPFVKNEDIDGYLIACRAELAWLDSDHFIFGFDDKELDIHGRKVRVHRDAFDMCAHEDHYRSINGQRCKGVDLGNDLTCSIDNLVGIRRVIREFDTFWELQIKMANLPLIVLAGLK